MRWSSLVAFSPIACAILISDPALANESPRLDQASKWVYQLQGDLTPLASHDADIAVIDIDGVKSKSALAAIKTKPGGGRRAVLSYLSIGEAETYRRYFKSCCLGANPTWLTDITQGWADNFLVRYWERDWKEIVKARLLAIVEAGFDGVYFDRVDSYEAFRDTVPSARQDMIELVRELASTAREVNPNFLIVVQNAEELLADSSYLDAVDAVAKEDLLFGVRHDRSRNEPTAIASALRHLARAKQKGKAILVVEYDIDAEARPEIAAEIRSHGFVPYLAPRELDRVPAETP